MTPLESIERPSIRVPYLRRVVGVSDWSHLPCLERSGSHVMVLFNNNNNNNLILIF